MGVVVSLAARRCEALYRCHGPFVFVSCTCLRSSYWVSCVHGVEDALNVIHRAQHRRPGNTLRD